MADLDNGPDIQIEKSHGREKTRKRPWFPINRRVHPPGFRDYGMLLIMNRTSPRLPTAEIILVVTFFAMPLATGVLPTGASPRPLESWLLIPVSSPQKASDFSTFALSAIAG